MQKKSPHPNKNAHPETYLAEIKDRVTLYFSIQYAVLAAIAIPSSMHATLFELFSSARRNGTANEKSVSLGMSIIQKFTELHRGTITFSSEENLGTAFCLSIPGEYHEKR